MALISQGGDSRIQPEISSSDVVSSSSSARAGGGVGGGEERVPRGATRGTGGATSPTGLGSRSAVEEECIAGKPYRMGAFCGLEKYSQPAPAAIPHYQVYRRITPTGNGGTHFPQAASLPAGQDNLPLERHFSQHHDGNRHIDDDPTNIDDPRHKRIAHQRRVETQSPKNQR